MIYPVPRDFVSLLCVRACFLLQKLALVCLLETSCGRWAWEVFITVSISLPRYCIAKVVI